MRAGYPVGTQRIPARKRQIIENNWRPRRDLNPCYRRERLLANRNCMTSQAQEPFGKGSRRRDEHVNGYPMGPRRDRLFINFTGKTTVTVPVPFQRHSSALCFYCFQFLRCLFVPRGRPSPKASHALSDASATKDSR